MVLTGKTLRANPFRVTVIVILFWSGYYFGSVVRTKPTDAGATSTSTVTQPTDASAAVKTPTSEAGRYGDFELLRNQVNELKHDLEKARADTTAARAQLEFSKKKMEFLEKEKEKVKADEKTSGNDDIEETILERLPATSVWCQGKEKMDRICRFKNLCYHPKKDSFFIIIGDNTQLLNVPASRTPALLDLTSLDDHGVFYFNYDEVNQNHMKNVRVKIHNKLSFLLSRFHTGNIMHTLHDDALGLYHNLKQHAYHGPHKGDSEYDTFSRDVRLIFWEGHEEGGYGHVFKLFSDNPLWFKSNFEHDDDITCWRDIVVGQSKRANWYHYGFNEPQGPIPDKKVSGWDVREVSHYIQYRLGIIKPGEPDPEPTRVLIFSRRSDRLIVNEDELLAAMEKKFGLKAMFLRMEDHSFIEQVKLIREAKVIIGMHGSMLIMGLFMQRNTVLIEMYPFAVPGDNYTPYKTMSNLPGMDIIYRKWENKHKENNIPHPEYPGYHGGLNELSAEERSKVLSTETVPKHTCCTNPYWLFRIYQDTKVHVGEVLALAESALTEARSHKTIDNPIVSSMFPGTIPSKSVRCTPLKHGDTYSVKVEWDEPWTGVLPEKYSIWEHVSFKEYFSTEPMVIIPAYHKFVRGKVLEIWVRPTKGSWNGPYTEKLECKLEP